MFLLTSEYDSRFLRHRSDTEEQQRWMGHVRGAKDGQQCLGSGAANIDKLRVALHARAACLPTVCFAPNGYVPKSSLEMLGHSHSWPCMLWHHSVPTLGGVWKHPVKV